MGSVQQAVLEFDEEIQAPWRPRLALVPEPGNAAPARPPASHPSRRSPSRVGVCRPPSPGARPVRHAAHPSGEGAEARTVAQRPGRRPTRSTSSRRSPAGRPPAAGRRPAPGTAAPVRLRLTRRARRLVAVLALAGCLAAGSWLGQLLGGDGGDLRLAGQSSVVVQPGDTLWSIASSMEGDGDVRALVDEIQELNHLRDAGIRSGQTLLLP
jgi:nucleoid-associated protein YgaU